MSLSRASLGLCVFLLAACRIPLGSGGADSTDEGATKGDSNSKGANGGTGTGPVQQGTEDDPQGQTDTAEEAPTSFTGTSIRSGDTDDGVADESLPFRTLFNLPMLKINELIAAVHDMYTPSSASFRKYLSADDLASTYMPAQDTVDAVSSWISANGMKVERVATNRMLIQVSGTIGAFNKAFNTQAHKITRGTSNVTHGSNTLFATPGTSVNIPAALVGKIAGVLTLDPPAATGTVDTSGISVSTRAPSSSESATIAVAQQLYGATNVSAHGAGETIAIVGADAVRKNDTQSFWQSQGITRSDFTVVQVAEPPTNVNTEATLDIQWSGGLAPDADVIFYAGPDVYDSSLVFAFNEAAGAGKATVINDSYAHNESVTPIQVRVQFDRSALAAVAQGITVVSAAGDRSSVDSPGSSPYVLSVGGTTRNNQVWNGSGGGQSTSFGLPDWQKATVSGATHRACPDVAALADDLWYYTEGFSRAGGTSFASPLTTGLFTVVNSIRTKAGKPRVGWFNAILYTTPAVQATFTDIVSGESGSQQAKTGWDYTTGWGVPNVANLAAAIP